MFQSTHPHGVRQFWLNIGSSTILVSIHAPTRGATRKLLEKLSKYQFQSTHPHGVRRFFAAKFVVVIKFQSTHPHGVRPKLRIFRRAVLCFNPRTHTGCDPYCRSATVAIYVSIHAPTRGATLYIQHQCHESWCFNPRTHTGCDVC